MKNQWKKSENVSAILRVCFSNRTFKPPKNMEKWAGLGAGLNNILSWIRQSKLSAGLDAGVGLSKNRWAESFCPAWLTLTWASLLIHSAAFSRSRLPFPAKRLLLVQGGWAEGCGCCCGDAHSYTVAVPGIKDQGPCVSLAFVFMPPSSPGFSPAWNSFFVSPRFRLAF